MENVSQLVSDRLLRSSEDFEVRRFQTRGQKSVSSEFTLTTLAHNLLRIMNYFGRVDNLRACVAANE